MAWMSVPGWLVSQKLILLGFTHTTSRRVTSIRLKLPWADNKAIGTRIITRYNQEASLNVQYVGPSRRLEKCCHQCLMSLEFCHDSWRVGSEFDANNMNPWIKPTLCQLFRLVVVWDIFLASFWAFNNMPPLSQITWALLLTMTMITVYPSCGVWWDQRFTLWM